MTYLESNILIIIMLILDYVNCFCYLLWTIRMGPTSTRNRVSRISILGLEIFWQLNSVQVASYMSLGSVQTGVPFFLRNQTCPSSGINLSYSTLRFIFCGLPTPGLASFVRKIIIASFFMVFHSLSPWAIWQLDVLALIWPFVTSTLELRDKHFLNFSLVQ